MDIMPFKLKIVVLVVCCTLLSSCFTMFNPGPGTLIRSVYNPSKTKQAILFLKGGNATADDSMRVSFMLASYNLGNTEVSNTFTADSNHVLSKSGFKGIIMLWLSDDTLQISYDKYLRTFIQVNEISNVKVVYKTF